MVLGLFNIGPLEFLIMAAAAVMLCGGDLPETARKAARTLGRLRALASELGREFSASDDLPTRKDIDLDLRRLGDLDDRPRPERPQLPGRREDEPLPPSAEDTADELPAWRRQLRSELPDADDAPAAASGDEAARETADQDSAHGDADASTGPHPGETEPRDDVPPPA